MGAMTAADSASDDQAKQYFERGLTDMAYNVLGSRFPDVAPDVVTGGRSGRPPAVVLFGCETGGSAADPSGFAMRFLNAGAGVVFSTLAKLGASTASLLADRLIAALRDPARDGQSVAQVLRDVRAEGLREHQVSALALTAYGRTAWEV